MFVTWPVLIAVSFIMHFANSSDTVADAVAGDPTSTQAVSFEPARMGGEGSSRSAPTSATSPNTPAAHHGPAKRP